MRNLSIKPTKKTLSINCSEGKIAIEGCSILNDPRVFFKPIESWLEDYYELMPEKTVFDFNLEYIDSPTTKYLYQLIESAVEKLGRTKVEVNWFYSEHDPEIMELGEIMQSKLRFSFNFINISRYKNKTVETA